MSKCFGCYQSLDKANHSNSYHGTCSKKLFGTDLPPQIDFGKSDLEELAKKSISQHLGITGVQPKIALHIEKKENNPKHRFMIVDLWGNYILKPPTHKFPFMPVVEDLTMHMARFAGIQTAQHGLIQMQSGELAYVSKRFDREKNGKKIAVEDFCQLSELLTESKYDTSTEKAGKIILKYSTQPGLDAVSFFDLNLFCFLTGNADMHLKNFSLIRNNEGDVILSQAYDLISTKLMPLNDKEEMALTINGKKAKIKKIDFIELGKKLQLSEKVMNNSFTRTLKGIPEMKNLIKISFLPAELKKQYNKLIEDRAKILT